MHRRLFPHCPNLVHNRPAQYGTMCDNAKSPATDGIMWQFSMNSISADYSLPTVFCNPRLSEEIDR